MKILPKKKVDNVLKEPVVFYCKDCEKIVEVKPVGRKFVYRCAVCNTKNVAFGTEKAIRNYYRVEDDEETPEDEGISIPEDASESEGPTISEKEAEHK